MTTHLQIRAFQPGDQEPVCALILAGLGEHFGYIDETRNPDLEDIATHYLEQGHTCIVALHSGTLVGAGALLLLSPEIGQIVRVSVAPLFRRRGIARALVDTLLHLGRARGLRLIQVETNNDWYDAIGLYEQCGFLQYDQDNESVYLAREL